MTFRPIAALLLAATFVSPVFAAPQVYQFDKAHTNIIFFINHLGFSNMEGEFKKFDGTLNFDPENIPASSVQVSIQVEGVETDVPKLNEHLQKAEFFNAAQFPTMDFASTAVSVTGENQLKITGNLTLLGVTQPVTLDVVLNKAGPHPFSKAPAAGFSATTTIKRSDFGMTAMTGMLGEEVSIRIETEAQVAK
ncbi:MAG: YceI family protein [Xanthomonadaceae bacterium]|nr:YceI family protein [Xanthomonadaceae bacterium]MDP2187003.1 YceI family protein [Xanthomonadales bacterium]MDZ4115583.1 YceI family protein [Xanthomonadaceae bacterium]MDZ4377373.1 YceI family protein [Xanthomonadaceae bacterium]